ncbi:MAG: leucine-rich repeat domain-containing protein, partial [Acutalibacteraceae bacterium]|nr:leucine-rich repeat domain-containing protein [Acutalibacteraceae bacterium]
MKRLTSILLSIIMLLSVTTSVPLSVSAETTNVVKSGAEHTYTDQYGKWTYKLTDDGAGCIITKYDESMLDIEIPSSIDDLPVLEIESNTFNYYRKITSVKIPYSVTNIALRTFRDCENLTSIEVSPDNPCYSSIDGVLFNKTQTEIIQFPVNKLSDSYSSSYVIPDSVITVGDNAFYHCKNLTSVTIPDGVITIGDGAFLSCDITTLDLPDSVITIGNHSFGECDITALELPNSVTSIGDYAFDGCTGLTDIEIPYGVITIGERAFDNCTNLTSIKFPSSVTALGDPLFYACYNLTSVEVSPDNPYYSSIDGVLFDKTQSKLIYYPSGKPASSYIIPGSVTAIGDYAFTNCTSLTSMAIPSNVTAIGNYTFWRCYNLTNVTMTNSVTYIGMFSFSKCLSLSSITLSNSIHCILGSTFYDCISLTGITLPSELIYMSGDAFEYCRNLTDIYFPGSESEWNDINIFAKDYYLNDKTIHYNCENSVEGNITRSTYKDQY